MRQYRLSPRAQRDLEETWDYTSETWSEDQAAHYIGQIRRAVETIAAEPLRGRKCDEVRAGYFRFNVGSHVLFYRMRDSSVEIVRVLHQRMDFDTRL